MPTARQRLEATLIELQAELAELPELHAATRTRLQATLSDIRAALATDRDTPEVITGAASLDEAAAQDATQEDASKQSLGARLNDATRDLESTHPELATTLGGVINALAQMGI